MTLHLPLLPGPGAVATLADRMYCPHLRAVLTARVCVGRHTARRPGHGPVVDAAVYPECAPCADGRALTARLGRAAPAPCRVPGCPLPRGRTRGTTLPVVLHALCVPHRARAQGLRGNGLTPDDAVLRVCEEAG